MHYYKFNIADWSLHTGHLSVEEEAVYFRLINHYYDTEVPIPKITQPVIRRLRLGSHAEVVAIILEEFFTLIGDLWTYFWGCLFLFGPLIWIATDVIGLELKTRKDRRS